MSDEQMSVEEAAEQDIWDSLGSDEKRKECLADLLHALEMWALLDRSHEHGMPQDAYDARYAEVAAQAAAAVAKAKGEPA